MKLTCLKSDITEAITNVQRAVSTKSTIPVLEGILLKAYDGQINISGYDLEIGITTNIDATILEKGEVVVSARLFYDIVRKLPEEIVSIETDERMITYIKSGQTNYQIVGMSSVEFPDLPTFEKMDSINIKAGKLKEMISQTVYAVSDNNAKPIYTGSLFKIEDKKFKIVAVDGYRMAIREEDVENESNNSFVVPGKTQNEVLKLINDDEENVEIVIGQRHTAFKINEYSIISRLIEGEFLDYNSTIPKGATTELVVNTSSFTNAIERMALLNNDRIKSPVHCHIRKDDIKFSCTTSIGKANDVLPVSTIGEEVEIGFNNRYLLDAMKNTDTDEVKLILNGGLTPMVVKPIKGDDFLFLVVPMRLGHEN